MTRDYASKIACALDQVESFEVAMDVIEQALFKAEELGCDFQGFDEKIRTIMEEELSRRVAILEKM